MDKLKVIEQNGQRVLTSSQLADAFDTDIRVISNNFSRNKDRYVEGKHFFLLEGETLRLFKSTTHQFDESLRKINRLYLWTEKGAWLHAKSLNTERAWEAYEQLVDDYYDIKQQAPTTALQSVDERSVRMELLKTALEHENRLGNIEERVANVERSVTLDYGEQRGLQRVIARRVYELEPDAIYRPDLFRQIHREIRDRWGVGSYRDVRRAELDGVIAYVKAWKPKMALLG